MAVIPAQVQSVNSSYSTPQDNPFLTMLQAGAQGYFSRKNLPQDLIKSAFPNLVATKQVRPAQPGEQTILPNVPWAWNQGLDVDELSKMQLYAQRKQDLDPSFQAFKFATSETARATRGREETAALLGPAKAADMYKNAPSTDEIMRSNMEMYLRNYPGNDLNQVPAPTAPGQITVSKKKKSIPVIRLSDGQTGEIPESEWDPSIYKLNTGA